MKKIVSIVIAAAVCVGAVSCGKKKQNKQKDSPAVSAPIYSYNSAYVEMADEFDRILSLDMDIKSKQILLFGQLESGEWSGIITDSAFSDSDGFSFSPDENEIVLGAGFAGTGKKAVLSYKEGSTVIHIISADGTEEKRIDCDVDLNISPDENATGEIYPCGEGFVVRIREMALFIGSGGESEEINTKGSDIYGIFGDGDSGVTLLLNNGGTVGTASVNGTNIGSLQKCEYISSSAVAMCCGTGRFSCIAAFADGIYGLEGGKWIKLSDLTDAPFQGINILGIIMTAENEFAVLTWTKNGTAVYLLTERDISQLKSKKVIKIATVSDMGYISDMIRKYNDSHQDGDYRMELVNYTYRNETGQTGVDMLKTDIVSGNAPDLITYPIDGIDLNGYYMDLYEYIEKDPDISREDFIPNILEAISCDGKLPYIIPTFQVKTMIAKTKFPFVKKNWNYDDFIAACGSLPDGMKLTNGLEYKLMQDNFNNFVNIYDFVDDEKSLCSFNSQQFEDMLDLVRDNHMGMTQEEASFFDGNIPPEDPMDISKDRILTPGAFTIQYFQQIWTTVSYFDDDVTFAGLPSLNGSGSYAVQGVNETELSIPRNAENPKGAWDFIKFFFSEQGYKAHRLGIPIYQEHFDKTADHCLKNDPGNEDMAYLPEDGWITAVRYKNAEGTEYEIIEPLTEKELEQYKDFVYNAAKRYCRKDNELELILYEELQEFFNSDKSAEETAEMIQNRASVYLSETYG